MKDNFSKQAEVYAKYRPDYPSELFQFVVQNVNQFENAWDCATGNGQTAKELSKFFQHVSATDISQKQLEKAPVISNVSYSIQPADKTNFSNEMFDLVTISQSLQWFATESFYQEVNRVAKKGAVIAAWSYSLLHITPEIDKIINHFYTDIIGPYWDAERRYVDEEYRTIPFPFEEIKAPRFTIQYEWTVDELEGYINTWSALQKFVTDKKYNPTKELMKKIRPLAKGSVTVTFPIHIRMGRVEK